jgi:2-haloacid dehalogenase
LYLHEKSALGISRVAFKMTIETQLPPKAVVFDIGNVLIKWEPFEVYDLLVGPARRKAFFSAVPILHGNEEVDQGENFNLMLDRLLGQFPHWSAEIEIWRNHWCDMVQNPIPGSIRLKDKLIERGIPVFALSNFGRETFETALKMHPTLRDFDRTYISGRLGIIKPNPNFFKLVEEDSGLSGQDFLFTDDRQENIASAEARGWRTHLFQTAEGLARCLIDLGLLSKIDVN